MKKVFPLILLQVLMLFMSLSSICSKTAASKAFPSFEFILFYGISFAILAMYAIAWQQLLKIVPLMTAYTSKAVTIFWGMVWGVMIFHETITYKQLIGCALVVAGVVIYNMADIKSEDKDDKNVNKTEDKEAAK